MLRRSDFFVYEDPRWRWPKPEPKPEPPLPDGTLLELVTAYRDAWEVCQRYRRERHVLGRDPGADYKAMRRAREVLFRKING